MTLSDTMKKIEAGDKIKVNGWRNYRVTKIHAESQGADLVGPRGGCATLIQNIHNPESVWFIPNHLRSEEVRSLEIV